MSTSWCFFSNHIFFFLQIATNMTCSQSCWSLHFLLTNTDAHSNSGHQSFSLLWATLRAIRRFFFLINLKLNIRFWHHRISEASLAYSACVCVSTLWDVGLTSDQAVTGSLFLSSTILLLKLVMNYYLQSFPFLLNERRAVVSYWQTPLQALLYLLDESI